MSTLRRIGISYSLWNLQPMFILWAALSIQTKISRNEWFRFNLCPIKRFHTKKFCLSCTLYLLCPDFESEISRQFQKHNQNFINLKSTIVQHSRNIKVIGIHLIQKCFYILGTEWSSRMAKQLFDFKANKDFLFALKSSDKAYFVGRVVNPDINWITWLAYNKLAPPQRNVCLSCTLKRCPVGIKLWSLWVKACCDTRYAIFAH